MEPYIPLMLALLAIAIVAAIATRSRGSKSRLGGFAWALMFLSGGRMPPPPPPSQIEQEAEQKKNREIGRAK